MSVISKRPSAPYGFSAPCIVGYTPIPLSKDPAWPRPWNMNNCVIFSVQLMNMGLFQRVTGLQVKSDYSDTQMRLQLPRGYPKKLSSILESDHGKWDSTTKLETVASDGEKVDEEELVCVSNESDFVIEGTNDQRTSVQLR